MSYVSDRIRDTLSPLEVAERFGVKINKKGFSVCPFHTEKTPSMFFDPWPGGRYHCYGCGADGDSISFVKKILNVDYKTAIQEIEKMFNLGIVKAPTRDNYDANSYMLNKIKAKVKSEKESNGIPEQKFQEMLARHCTYHQTLKQRPASWEEMTPDFIEALQNIDQLSYEIDCEMDRRYSK